MQPLQLTPTERVGFTEQIKSEIAAESSSSTVLTFDQYDGIAVVIEYDDVEENLIFSVKIRDMIKRVPERFIGSPDTLGELDSPAVENICEEVDTVLWNEFTIDSTLTESEFTFYEWEEDAAWYLYEVDVEPE